MRRKMLYELSENVTDENLRDIKFLLHNLPKAKMASATFLEVLAEMEKTEMLGKDNLDELENVLSKCSKELAYRVQKFKKASGIKNPVYITPGQQEENHLPVQPQDVFMPNMSIAETNPEFSPVTSSLPIESMDTDSEKLQASETSPANEIDVDDCYPMTQRPVGYCLIINNHIFHPSTNLRERKGTHADKDSLTEVFQRMHFKVEERRDLLSSDMLETVKEFSERDHSKMDAFVCCILSHGEKGTVLGTDGIPVPIRDLTKPFACCKMLTGKPKLFFIQACQGNNLQKVWDEDGTEDDQFEYDAERAVLRSVPIEADFLIGMATVESYKSFRHIKTGSIFIQELCKCLQLGCSRNEDILSILTRVNSRVSAKELNFYCKQMPEPRYTLTKKLVLPMD
ncbi:caspase-8 isoform X2 [Tachysurus fulvidraco]|uniref:caspase-8 isoform X2 n=1 Tax=Tachysurus fulvidraco TaxID=1234273 RepID=UPI001FEE1101|nr:caspase-8 isoform X2 [Tachysurus fulvidraco]